MRPLITLVLRWIAASGIAFFSSIITPVIKEGTLRTSFGFLRLFTDAVREGSAIHIGDTTLNFIPACAAVSAYALLAILILLTRGIDARRGVLLFLYGSLLIFLANIVRIELLIYVLLKYGINYFQTLHIMMWKIVASIYVAVVWVFLAWRFQIKAVPIFSDVMYVLRTVRVKKQ